MEKQEIVFEAERATKNTIRYQEMTEGKPPRVGALYIQKWVVGTNPPRRIKVTIEPVG